MNNMPDGHESTVSFSLESGADLFFSVEKRQNACGMHLSELHTLDTDPHTGQVLSAKAVWRSSNRPPMRAPGGRLGVVIPTLNCRKELPRQVEAMSAWLDLVDEVVVVDGFSTDGTAEYMEAINHPRLRVVRHPRGLWQSWNAGLALLSTEYALVATVGDVADRDGVEHLLEVAAKTQADIVLSPPYFETHDGSTPPPENWPIHSLINELCIKDVQVLEPVGLLMRTFKAAGFSQGILGSSASNLYRTKLLQEHPFPVDAFHAGDVAWGLRHIQRTKVAITPRKCAAFMHHPKPAVSHNQIREKLLPYACRAAGISEAEVGVLLQGQAPLIAEEAVCAEKLRTKRKRFKVAWLLSLEAWQLKARRDALRGRIGVGTTLANRVPPHFGAYLEGYIAHKRYWSVNE